MRVDAFKGMIFVLVWCVLFLWGTVTVMWALATLLTSLVVGWVR